MALRHSKNEQVLATKVNVQSHVSYFQGLTAGCGSVDVAAKAITISLGLARQRVHNSRCVSSKEPALDDSASTS
jgi:hypothetical protein